jgi:putative hydrolase of the HAD superfamily
VAYHGLILDFGGVVTTDFYGALSAFCEHQGLPPDAVLRVLRDTTEGREALAAVEIGHLAQADYETILANLLGVSSAGLLGRALADLRPRQEVLDLIRDARDAGIEVGVLSNSWGTGTYDPYDGYGLDRLVDAAVISDQVGLRKPDPAIYKLIAGKLGVPAEACVFVDDTAANLPAASNLGMTVVHFTDAQSAVAEIRHLLGLA